MDISRRSLFALPIVLPVAMTIKPERSTAWTDEEASEEAKAWEERAREEAVAEKGFKRQGSCEGWMQIYNVEHDIGHLKCSDDRLAFFQRDLIANDEC